MLRPRIIPALLLDQGRLIKTEKFSNPKYVGDPINAVRIFNEKACNELIIIDITASERNTEPNYDLISKCASECRMPLCYGGGVSTVEQIKRIVGLGVEKVAVCSNALTNVTLIKEAAEQVGSQSVVVVIDVKKVFGHDEYVVTSGRGKNITNWKLIDWIREVEKLGAGEILINNVDRDGTNQGYDMKLAKLVRDNVTIPISFMGGAGGLVDLKNLLSEIGVVGAVAGSLFVFKGKFKAVLLSYPSTEELDVLCQAAWARESKPLKSD